jgi:hypothetical protein
LLAELSAYKQIGNFLERLEGVKKDYNKANEINENAYEFFEKVDKII